MQRHLETATVTVVPLRTRKRTHKRSLNLDREQYNTFLAIDSSSVFVKFNGALAFHDRHRHQFDRTHARVPFCIKTVNRND